MKQVSFVHQGVKSTQRILMYLTVSSAVKRVGFGLLLTLLSGCQEPEKTQSTESLKPSLKHYSERDIRDEVFYFVLPDRFSNGDPSNDQGDPEQPESYGGYDPTSPGHYHGGDLLGLTQRLDYLKEMGVTAIWLTPVLRNLAVQGDSSGYHGYWPIDFTSIDPHLGSNEALKTLIDEAHQRNMKVFFDIITNHTADVIKYRECHLPDAPKFSTDMQLCEYRDRAMTKAGQGYTPYLIEGTETLKHPSWLNDPRFYHNQGDSTWTGENSVYGDFMGLDDIDTDNPEVVNGMIQIFNNIIKEFKPDGFRVDTVKHVNIEFWQQFTPAIMAFAQQQGITNFFVFGEVYSGDPKELSYYTTTGKMPSVLDFAFQYKVKDALIYGKGTDQLSELFAQDKLYLDEDSHAGLLMNFISNHDVGRFAFTLQQQLPQASEANLLRRVQLANAMMFLLRGVPVIYYGDEQGFTGDGGDRGAREDMMMSKTPQYNDNDLLGTDATTADNNFDEQHPLYQSFKYYAQIYRQFKALRLGDQEVIIDSSTPGIFLVKRSYDDQSLWVAINTAESSQSISLDSVSQSLAPIVNNSRLQRQSEKTWILEPLSFAIFQ